jgi:DNA (cytosine-5)-methyltransferase 1
MTLTVLDLFSGIGGFSYAAEQLVGGFKTKAFCEIDSACQAVLQKHWPDVPIFDDVCSLTADDLDFCPDVITAGFPCQDLSVAGKQAGYDGKRSVLFYEIIRLARELRPRFLLLENVRNLLSHKDGETFQETLFQIAKAGYDAEWAVIPASDLGACHRRERIWIVAYASSADLPRWGEGSGRRQRSAADAGGCGIPESSRSADFATDPGGAGSFPSSQQGIHRQEESRGPRNGQLERLRGAFPPHANNKGLQGQRSQRELSESSRKKQTTWCSGGAMLSPEWGGYLSKPVLRRGDDGLSNRVDRLKQLGNSIVPQVAAVPLARIRQLAAEQYADHV